MPLRGSMAAHHIEHPSAFSSQHTESNTSPEDVRSDENPSQSSSHHNVDNIESNRGIATSEPTATSLFTPLSEPASDAIREGRNEPIAPTSSAMPAMSTHAADQSVPVANHSSMSHPFHQHRSILRHCHPEEAHHPSKETLYGTGVPQYQGYYPQTSSQQHHYDQLSSQYGHSGGHDLSRAEVQANAAPRMYPDSGSIGQLRAHQHIDTDAFASVDHAAAANLALAASKPIARKGRWSQGEDHRLRESVAIHGPSK